VNVSCFHTSLVVQSSFFLIDFSLRRFDSRILFLNHSKNNTSMCAECSRRLRYAQSRI
jgi:hypothetical protein